jgi:hypothetical protein
MCWTPNEERRRPEPQEPVDSARRCDSHLTGMADPCVAVDVDEDLAFEDGAPIWSAVS